jgi:predicted glycosyltransferase
MVNYVLGQLWESDSYYLTIRAHPILPFNWIRNRIDYKIEKSSRISASENDSVFDDLINSDIVIYWGSTVALEALSLGIPLIRYRMGNLLSYDPLFECDHLKWECSENNSLIDTIESIYQLSDEEFSNRAQEAKKYLDRYFHPVTDSNLNKFVYA